MRTSRHLVIAFALVALCLAASPALAQDTGQFRFGLTYIAPVDESTVPNTGTVEADAALGYRVAYEHFLSESMGLEASVEMATHDVEVNGSELGEVDLMPVTLALNFYVARGDNYDVYIAPMIGHAIFDDVEINGGGELETDDEWFFGAGVGVDLMLAENWYIGGALRYYFLDVDVADSFVLDVNPFAVHLGVSYRF